MFSGSKTWSSLAEAKAICKGVIGEKVGKTGDFATVKSLKWQDEEFIHYSLGKGEPLRIFSLSLDR
jgi:hypothetical protein